MNLTLYLSYIGTVLLLAMTPGPSVLLVTANGMNHGVRKTLGTILGDLSANLVQIVLASLGLASIIMRSGEFLVWMKWAGVCYLVYMGIQKILAEPATLITRKQEHKRFVALYGEGFLMSAANPKAILFFAALFPLFIDPALPFVQQIVVLALTFLLIDGTCLLLYTAMATRMKSYLQARKKLRLQNRITGILLIFSGLMLSLVKVAQK